MDNAARVARIMQKLTEARRRRLSCFGSDSHNFELTGPRSEADVAAFEQQHAITLPEAYRAFLLHGGGRGAGPYYGLYPLEAWDEVAGCFMERPPSSILAEPNPLPIGASEIAFDPDEQRLPDAFRGAMTIGTQGCSYNMMLIVSGEHRGRVLYVATDSPEVYVSREPDFLAWYERWLDELIGGHELAWFGYGPGGGEAELLELVESDASDDALKAEAARNLARLARLTADGAKRVQALLSHSLAPVRAAACSAVAKHAIQKAPMAALLRDADADVRRSAVDAVMQLSPAQWATPVREVLKTEADAAVSGAALRTLDKAGKLTEADVLHVLAHGPEAARVQAVQRLGRSSSAREALIARLDDPVEDVRLFAALNLRHHKPPPVDILIARLDVETNATTVDHLMRLLIATKDKRAADTLLRFINGADAFQRIEALRGLAALGDARALAPAEAMLADHAVPERRSSSGVWMSHSISTAVQAQEILHKSPHRAFRDLLHSGAR